MHTGNDGLAAKKPDEDVIHELAETILQYLATRPNACDTVEGVRQWWIPKQRVVQASSDVVAALKLLESRGQIHARPGADGQVLYRACEPTSPD